MKNLQIACDKDLRLAHRRGLLRARALWYLKLSLNKHNIKNLLYCMGPEFQSGDDIWEVAQGPNGEICWKLPLPNDHECPLGLDESLNCSSCAKGFTGAKCTECESGRIGMSCKTCENYCPKQAVCEELLSGRVSCTCLPGHVGSRCLPCNCNAKQSCHVADDRPICFCDQGYHGDDCNYQAISPNLIHWPAHSNVEALQNAGWQIWKDGCLQSKSSALYIVNNGSAQCGIWHGIQLHQDRAQAIACSAIIDLEQEAFSEKEDSAMFCLWIDIHFGDKTKIWGKRECFSWGIGQQMKYLILNFDKPVGMLQIFIIAANVRVDILLKSISCYIVVEQHDNINT